MNNNATKKKTNNNNNLTRARMSLKATTVSSIEDYLGLINQVQQPKKTSVYQKQLFTKKHNNIINCSINAIKNKNNDIQNTNTKKNNNSISRKTSTIYQEQQ